MDPIEATGSIARGPIGITTRNLHVCQPWQYSIALTPEKESADILAFLMSVTPCSACCAHKVMDVPPHFNSSNRRYCCRIIDHARIADQTRSRQASAVSHYLAIQWLPLLAAAYNTGKGTRRRPKNLFLVLQPCEENLLSGYTERLKTPTPTSGTRSSPTSWSTLMRPQWGSPVLSNNRSCENMPAESWRNMYI